MQSKRNLFWIPIFLGALLIVGVLFMLWPTPRASAQCGSQASSCKNCHEIQGKDPVNNDGTGWHVNHAFGDFCYMCHAGNNQSMDEATAHTGMVPPLSDVKAGCQSCHPDDLMARAQVYATILGVEVGSGGGTGAGAGAGAAPVTNTGSATGDTAPTGGAVVADLSAATTGGTGEVIDYNLRYEGKTVVNWGNITLVALIALVAVGGGAFVIWNERKLRGLNVRRAAPPAPQAALVLPKVEGYSDEVVALLPMLARLNPMGLHAIRRLLENPEDASELLHSLSRLDPDLIKRLRSLDRDSRALLLALAGD